MIAKLGKKNNAELKDLAIKRANKSKCKHKVSAIGLNEKGEVVGWSFNAPRFSRIGGGLHAEMRLMSRVKGLKTIIICRTNIYGELKPIHPCNACLEKANDLGIKIVSINDMVKNGSK